MKKIIRLRYFKAVVFLSFILLAIPLTVWIAQQQQQLKQKAAFLTPKKTLSDISKNYKQLLKEKLIEPAGQILEVSLSYDESKTPQLSLGEIRRLNGYVPYHDQAGNYTLQIFDNNKNLLYSLKFDLPNKPHVESFDPSGKIELLDVTLKQVTFAQTLPWYALASEINILDPNKRTISVKSLADIPKIENKPDFKSIQGDEFIKYKNTGANTKSVNFNNPNNLFLERVSAQEKPKRKLNITFVGDGQEDYIKYIEKAMSYFFTIEPFKSRASQIEFSYVNSSDKISCDKDYCDISGIYRLLNDKGSPYDFLAIITNNANLLTKIQLVYYIEDKSSPKAFVHEFGHSLELKDEYIYNDDLLEIYNLKFIDNRTYNNCFSGDPPVEEWNVLVGIQDYAKGCSNINWHRPSINSVMNDVSFPYFNSVSQKILNFNIDKITGAFTDDRTPPTAKIVSVSQLQQQSLSGNVKIETVLSDDQGISFAQLWVDNQPIQTAYVSPYSFIFHTPEVRNGIHILQVKAYDVSGNGGRTEQILVTVNNNSDKTPPHVKISGYPLDGKTVDVNTKGASLDIEVTDESGIKKIEAYMDGEIMRVYSDYYTNRVAVFYIEPHIFKQGGHRLYVKAYDYAGNQTTSNPISFNTINPKLETCVSKAKSSQGKEQCNALYMGLPFITPSVTSFPALTISPTNSLCPTKGNVIRNYCSDPTHSVTVFADGTCGTYQSQTYDCQTAYPDIKGICNLGTCTRPVVSSSIVPTNTPTPTPIPCPLKEKGDANCDGRTNTDDFNIWRDENYKVLTTILADFNGDNKIDILDFNIWLSSMGNQSLPH